MIDVLHVISGLGTGGAETMLVRLSGMLRARGITQHVVSLGAQAARLDYPEPNAPRDAELWGVSAGYKVQFRYPWQPAVTLGASAGSQHSRTGRPDLTPRTRGANATLNLTPAAKWGVAVGYNYLQSDYRGPDLFGAESRLLCG